MDAKLSLKKLILSKEMTFIPADLVADARNSQGGKVTLNQMTAVGTVNTQVVGDYPVIVKFKDPFTHVDVQAMSMVTVKD